MVLRLSRRINLAQGALCGSTNYLRTRSSGSENGSKQLSEAVSRDLDADAQQDEGDHPQVRTISFSISPQYQIGPSNKRNSERDSIMAQLAVGHLSRTLINSDNKQKCEQIDPVSSAAFDGWWSKTCFDYTSAVTQASAILHAYHPGSTPFTAADWQTH